MWKTSQAFNDALLEPSRRWATKIEVLYGTEIVTTLNVLISGYIGIDNVAVRREAHFTIVDADGVLTPAQASDLLAPKGTEMRIYRGLWIRGDSGLYGYEWVPMGVFGIVEPQVRSHSEGTVVEIKGFDRVDKLRALHFEDPWTVKDGTFTHTALASIISSRMPGVPVRITQSAFTSPEVVFDRLSSPWDAIKDLCEASAYVVYFDQLGSAVIEPYTEVPSGVSYTIGPKSVLMTSSRTFSTDTTYSGVIVRGEHPDRSPVKVTLWDSDPASPTYAFGPFGKRPFGFYSQLITTEAQATAVAGPILARVAHMKQEVEIETRGHPGHDIADVISVDDPRSRTKGDFSVISATVPLVNEQGAHVRLRCEEAGYV